MVVEHDFKEFPELTNKQMEELQFQSPHKQITEDFKAVVVRIHDGDTITLSVGFRDFNFPLRLLDIDAPEMNEGGEAARDWLRGRILDEIVEIKIERKNRVDKYGRLLGRVIHGGSDVGEEELRQGLAIPFTRRREGKIPSLEETFTTKWQKAA